jgi:hypothetical protein
LAIACGLTPRLAAQPGGVPPPAPTLLTVFPCGAKAGSSVEVTIGGTGIDPAGALYFSTRGVTAKPLGGARFRIDVDADAPLGIHDVRAVTPKGITNPRAFVVGDRPETVENEPNDDVPQAQRIELNSTVNGVISASTDVDYFVFAGKKGQRVLASCLTSSIDSRLEAGLELYDTAGRRLGANRKYFENDALLDVTLPADGDFYLRLFQYAYARGDAQHFYRLTITTGPWIDAVFPPIVTAGVASEVSLFGRNLPGGADTLKVRVLPPDSRNSLDRLDTTALVPPRSALIDGFDYRLVTPDGASNPVWLTVATAPVILETEPNDTRDSAQSVALPCEIAGRIDRPSDRDWYRFDLKKGESVMLDLAGDRLGSPCDFYMSLRAPDGKEIRELDDPPVQDVLHPFMFFNRTADPPATKFTAPADDSYFVVVGARDAAVSAGPRAIYRLRIGPERPDFRLVVMPSLDNAPQTQAAPRPEALLVPTGGRHYLEVFVSRRDGFNSPITLTAEDLPLGVTCPPQILPPNARQSALVLEAAAAAKPWAGAIQVIGRAEINKQIVVRETRPASVTWPMNQRNAPAIARLDRQLVMAVGETGAFALSTSQRQLVAHSGDPVRLRVDVARNGDAAKGAITLHLLNQQANVISLNGGVIPAGESSTEVTITPRPSAPLGEYQIVLVGKSEPVSVKDPAGGNRRINVAHRYPAPPITLTVQPAQGTAGK